jgi:putative nucleotidyltransferase with HDIG domain
MPGGGAAGAANIARTSERRGRPGIVEVLIKLRDAHPSADDESVDAGLRRLAHFADELEQKEGYASEHSGCVVTHALAIAEELGLGAEDRALIELGAALHDLGKLCVRESILAKPGPLSEPEWDVMRLHAIAGAQLLRLLIELPEVTSIVRSHHERWDGLGYPDGLARDRIPLGARIVAVADAYQAMVEPRPYRQDFSEEAARHQLLECAGTQFDPTCVEALCTALSRHERRPLQHVG